MKKLICIILMSLSLMSCADALKQQQFLEKSYPTCKVEPATGLIQRNGYDYILVQPDGQLIAVKFYPGSENKIASLRNVR